MRSDRRSIQAIIFSIVDQDLDIKSLLAYPSPHYSPIFLGSKGPSNSGKKRPVIQKINEEKDNGCFEAQLILN